LVSHIKERTRDFKYQVTEENIWPQEDISKRRPERVMSNERVMRTIILSALQKYH
jgi:hypothetical protein